MNTDNKRFRLYEHPWLAMVIEHVVGIGVLIATVLGAGYIGIPEDAPYRPLITPTLAHLLVLFLIVPFILRLPSGKTSFKKYLSEIRLLNLKPFFPLILLGLSCSLIALLSLSTQSLAYRISQGLPVTVDFLSEMIPVKNDLPPSLGYINAFPSIFEEISWRGVMLVLFSRKYSPKKSILITGLGFSLLHFLNLIGDVDPGLVFRQVIFTAGMGIFYGALVLRANSLLPAMLFHFLVNMFMGSFTHYLQRYAPGSTQILYLILNIPVTTILLLAWAKFYWKRWLEGKQPSEQSTGVLAWERR